MRKERAVRSSALRAKYIAVAVTAAFAPWSVYGQTPAPDQMPSITLKQGIAVVNPATGTYQLIDQASLRAIYEGSMTMGSNAHLHLFHSIYGGSGIGLFKDVSGSLSQIFGRITSNGQVFISNPNGVLFGSTARIDVGALFATTLSANEEQFMAGGARIQWTNNGATGTVTNQGEIITANGYTALVGPQVRNDGIIRARTGQVALAAGDRVSLDLIGDGLIRISVDQAAMNASVVNTGTIEAEGGTVLLTARSANALLDTVINAGGTIRATSLIERNGEIVLDGGNAGTVMVAGNHNAGSSSVSGANVTMTGTIVTDLGSGTQTVTTPGTLTIQGSGVSATNAGLIHQGSGEQSVVAGNVIMTGGTGIGTNAVITSSDASAEQKLAVSGNLQVTGGAAGDGNQAIIRSAGNQTIDAAGAIVVEGGANSGLAGGNTAFIVGAASNQLGKKQTINAGSITMKSGAAGNQNGAVILGPKQEITTTGDVLLAGGGTAGVLGGVRMGGLSTGAGGAANTATDLTLAVGNDLLMRGGVTPSNSANIGSTTGQPQTVTITAARDVVVNDAPTSVSRIGTVQSTLPTNGTPGDISVTAGRDIRVNGGGEIVTTGKVTLSALNGAVKVEATSPAAGGARVQSATGQDIKAKSLTVTAQNRSAQIINNGGEQSIQAGTVDLQTLGAVGGLAEIRNNSAADQKLTVSGDHLTVNALGGGTAQIFGNGNQTIDMTRVGAKTITVGDHAAQGRSSIASNGDQTITGKADLVVTGGSGPVADASNATISVSNPNRLQRIDAGKITLANSILGGNNSVAGLQAANQLISTTGNVSLTANASGGVLPGVRIGGLGGAAPTATNLTLDVGGDLILTGGSVPGNGVGIGSTGAVGAPPLANNITITAAGSVILSAGTAASTGARIGAPNSAAVVDPGTITVAAGNELRIGSGTGIRANGPITLTSNGLTNNGTISNGGGSSNVVLNANTFALASGSIEGGTAAVVVRPKTGTNSFGIEAAGATTLTNADIASIHTSDFVVFGSGIGNTFTGNMTIGQNAQVDGGGKHLAFFRSANPGGTTTIGANGASTTGNMIVSAGGGAIISNGGTLTANELQLRASQGIGSAASRVRTEANALAINNTGGAGAFVSEASGVALRNVNLTVGGNINSVSNFVGGAGAYDVSALGPITVSGPLVTTNGAITLTASSLTNGSLITNGGGSSTSTIILNADAFNLAGGTVEAGAGAVAVRPTTGTNSFGIESAATTTLTNADIASIHTSDFVIFGSSTGNVFTGNMTIGENARVEGNGKNLAFSRSLTPGAEMITIGSQGVATTGDVIIGAGGGGIRSNGGTVTGDEVVLRATNGIGTPTARVKTAANALALNNAGGGGVFVSELDNVTLRTISLNAGGPLTVSNTNNGSFSLISGGDVNVAGTVTSGGSMILTAAGALNLDGTAVDAVLSSNGGQTVTAQSMNFTAANGRRAVIQNFNGTQTATATTGDMNLLSAGNAGVAQILNSFNVVPGDQTIDVAGQLHITGGAVGTSGNAGIFKSNAPGAPGGLQTVRAAGITLEGASSGTNAGAGIRSHGDQRIEVTGDIHLRGGNGGVNNGVFIQANPLATLPPNPPAAPVQQTIRARNIDMRNGVGGVDTSATITGPKQDIVATGNVTLTSEAALLGTVPGGPGVRIGAPGGTSFATDLTLRAGGNIVLNGGTVAENGAAIGSSGTGVAQPNKLVIDAGGSVILNAGNASNTGVRIGSGSSGTAGGDISIKAGGNIELNGNQRPAAVRTLNDVTLEAASIKETGNGFVQAKGLTTKSTAGDTTLTGPNTVSIYNGTSSANLSLTNSGPLTVTGVDATGNASLSNALGDVTLTGRWRSATAGISSGGSLIQSGGGFFQTGSLTTFVGGATNLGGANQIAVFSNTLSSDVTLNNTTGLQLLDVSGPNNVTVTAAGTIMIGGHVSANRVELTASGGGIEETAGGSITTGIGGTLTTFSTGNTTLNGANQMTAFTATSGADVSLNNDGFSFSVLGMNAAGNVTINNQGTATVAGPWTAGGTSTINAGDIQLTAALTSPHVVLNAGGFITESGAGAVFANTLSTTSVGLTSLTGPNVVASYDGQSGSSLTFNNNGALAIAGLDATGNASVTSFGDLTVTGAWRSVSADLRANGFGSAIRETGDGAIQTGSLTTFSEGDTSLTGANQVSSFNAATSFGGTGGVTVSNTGALNVTGLATGGNATLTNNGAVSVTGAWSSSGATNIATTGGDLTVTTNILRSTGAMDLDVGGRLVLSANGPQSVFVTGGAGQTVRAQGLEVTSQNGGFASLEAQGGDQRITVTGGSVDVQVLSGPGVAQISSAPGRTQTVQVIDGDHINVNGRGGSSFAAIITGPTSTQEVSITGSGANAIRLGSTGGGGFSEIVAGSQNVTAGSAGQNGSITIVGSSVNGRFAGMSTQPTSGGTQSVSTSGLLRVTGGNAPGQNLNAGLFHGGGGAQTVNAARIELIAGSTGIGNGAMIVSNGGNVPGNTAGAQTVTVTGDIVMEGGAGGNANITGGSTRLQKIEAHNISMTNAVAGGTDSGAFILGGLQDIHATGDVTMTARGAAGNLPGLRIGGLSGTGATSTNLKLKVDRDLILTGGTGNNGVGIGTTAAPPAGAVLRNDITIEARDVILNGGTGAAAAARIGASGAPGVPNFAGDIRITARDIKLNVDAPAGAQVAAIRTLGDVTLDAASISEGANGNIIANALSLKTTGDATLGGANQVNSLSAFVPGTPPVPGLPSFVQPGVGGNLVFNNTAPLNVNSTVASGGTMTVTVAGALNVTASAQDAALSSVGGQTINASALAVTSSNGRRASVSNLGGAQAINLSNGAGLDVRTLQPGGIAEVRNDGGGSQTINVVNGDHINVNGIAGTAAISNFGGTQSLSITGSGANAITLGAHGSLGPSQVLGGVQSVTAGTGTQSGSITIVGGNGNATFTGVSSGQIAGGTQAVSTSGTLRIDGGDAPNQPVNGFATGLFHNGSGEQKVSAANLAMQGGSSGLNNVAIIISSGGAGTIASGKQVVDVGSGNISLAGGSGGGGNTAIIVSFADQTVGAGSVALQGGAGGAGNGAFINSVAGGQLFDVAGALRVAGGAGGSASINNGTAAPLNGAASQVINAGSVVLEGGAAGVNNGAFINSSAGAQSINVSGDLVVAGGAGGSAGITGPATRLQSIRANNISMTNSAGGGINSVGFILGGHQDIHALGNVTMTARASGGDLPGVRIGGLSGAAATATDLTLTVGGDLILTGGTVAGNGVGIGSTAAPGPAFANNITITTGGDVILNSGVAGSAVRIGSSATTGPAGGDIRITAGGDLWLNGVQENAAIRTLGTMTLDAASIVEGPKGFIEAGTLFTRTAGDALLTGPNRVGTFTAESNHGNVHLTNSAPVLTLGSMDLPGNLTVVQTGDLAVGSASATQSTLVAAAGDVSMSASGQILVRGSDTTIGASSAVLAGGDLGFSAGDVTLRAGDAALTPVVVRGANGVQMIVGNELNVTAGGMLSPSLLTSGRSIDLTIGQALRIDGNGPFSLARVQTESVDGVISISFPNLTQGGYFVDGLEGHTHHGQTGFFTDFKPAKVGKTLLLDYGN